MDIKKFEKGQTAFMLTKNTGYNKPPETKMVNVITVGKKYVTVSNDIRFQDEDRQDNYLVENKDWGDRRLLFADENTLNEYLEKKKLIAWFRKSDSRFEQLSLDKMRKIHEIVEGPEQKTIILDFIRGTTHEARCFTVPECRSNEIYTMMEELRQVAIKDGYDGLISSLPNKLMEYAGFHIVDFKSVSVEDMRIKAPKYEDYGYFIPACKDCLHYVQGYCRKYDASTEPDDIESCFANDCAKVYKMIYCQEGVEDELFRFFVMDGHIIQHSAKELLQMFEVSIDELDYYLNLDDFDENNLKIIDENGNDVTVQAG